jgi:hypothetical protein
VYLKSGISGNIPRNRIRLLPDEPLEAGEAHEPDMWVLLHVAGDDNFAKLFAGQSSDFREGYGEFLVQCGIPFFSNAKPYIKLHFPKTYAILYGNAAQQTKADQKPIEEVKARAEAGDAESEVELGLRYTNGEGVAKDQVEAVKWFRKAAEQNFAPAQYNLNVCYYNGKGVAKDYVEAYEWLLLAARQGDEDAKKKVTELESKLTPEQIADGKTRARDFKPR